MENNKHKFLALTVLSLGLLSVLFGSIGIVPLIALVFGFISLFKLREMSKKNKIFSILGLLLAFIYSINFFLVFSSVGPNLLNISYEKNNYYDKSVKKDYPQITDMSLSIKTPDYFEFNDQIYWWFDDNINKHHANDRWGCYSGCYMVVVDSDDRVISNINLTGNGCLNWVRLPFESREDLRNASRVCAYIDCGDNIKSKEVCWEMNK